mmetsp:Transcript_23189/g.36947  ORF Transcript_23189/g.36947 Transcript_23189/m.36947 type:complete len:141 (-) Transcript_23189:113-535(-)
MGCSSAKGCEAPQIRSDTPQIVIPAYTGPVGTQAVTVSFSTLLGVLNENVLQDVIENSKKEFQAERLTRLVASLPKETYNSDHHQDLVECELCLEDYANGDELLRLPCMHAFHCHCVSPWLKKSGVCPSCRTELANEEDH